MNTKVTIWGNSLGVRIPKSYANDLGIQDGSSVDINVRNHALIIKPKPQKKPKKYNLETMAKKMNARNAHAVLEWHEPAGKEVW
ncbi:hypothetical protein UZ36_03925 [Candidatus Nitromaritima sp. SCGC AAA799-C22]|nr:hypothetical protein UZ36_03925 [Candidatus Nitromaritima sp. SCGC AAA799-C22]